jgi:NAD(P)H-flavin reductase/ferredoxin
VAERCKITVNGRTITARRGEVLLDAALGGGLDLPHDCRAGHCGMCCVRVVSGAVSGGEGAEPGIVHACQCRVAGDAVVESGAVAGVRTVSGVLASLRPLSGDVVEVGIRTDRALPHHPGQYTQVRFEGFPSRPYSITLPMSADGDSRLTWFHIRCVPDGRVTSAIGKTIRLGHRVSLTGPYGSAYFRPNLQSRKVLVAANTGFAPIWAIAVAALRESPERLMMVIAGGRTLSAIYMGPALAQLARFPNVQIVAACSADQDSGRRVLPGRPTDYLPLLLPSDVIYACGAPEMVEAVKAIAARHGAVCHADPFVPATDARPVANSAIVRRPAMTLQPGGLSVSSV